MSKQPKWNRVLLDTGPLVAILSRADSQHARCVETLREIQPPLLTCWPVLTEAAWLLRSDQSAVSRLLQSGESGLYRLLEVEQQELPDIDKLLARYRDQSPQLADLTILYLARRDNLNTIFTLDRRDFSIFRRKGRGSFHLLPEDDA